MRTCRRGVHSFSTASLDGGEWAPILVLIFRTEISLNPARIQTLDGLICSAVYNKELSWFPGIHRVDWNPRSASKAYLQYYMCKFGPDWTGTIIHISLYNIWLSLSHRNVTYHLQLMELVWQPYLKHITNNKSMNIQCYSWCENLHD
jgi:hypothetical protein